MHRSRRSSLWTGTAGVVGSLIPVKVLGANRKLICAIIGAGRMGRMCMGAVGEYLWG